MEQLLGEKQSEHFDEKYPLIYKNKIVKKKNLKMSLNQSAEGNDIAKPDKFFYRSAIDNALQNN